MTTEITLTKEETGVLVRKLQFYFDQELGQELGQFDAQFLLDFFSNELGVYFYNRGLYDAQAVLQKKLDDVTDAIYELEKPTEFQR